MEDHERVEEQQIVQLVEKANLYRELLRNPAYKFVLDSLVRASNAMLEALRSVSVSDKDAAMYLLLEWRAYEKVLEQMQLETNSVIADHDRLIRETLEGKMSPEQIEIILKKQYE